MVTCVLQSTSCAIAIQIISLFTALQIGLQQPLHWPTSDTEKPSGVAAASGAVSHLLWELHPDPPGFNSLWSQTRPQRVRRSCNLSIVIWLVNGMPGLWVPCSTYHTDCLLHTKNFYALVNSPAQQQGHNSLAQQSGHTHTPQCCTQDTCLLSSTAVRTHSLV